MAIKEFFVKLDLDIKGFNKKLKLVTASIAKASKKIGASLTSFGKSLVTKIALPAALAGAGLVKLASDAEETDNKFKEIFAKSAPQLENSLNRLAKTVGRNATGLKDFAADIGGTLSSMGFLDEEAASLSDTMIKLGLDVASFRNRSDPQVINAFRSALVGEREALKTLGVSILESDVKLEALRLGLVQGKEELTKRAKVLATVSLLQQVFAKDAGDLARTQGSFANVLKRFNANLKTTGEILGVAIIPFATKLLKLLTPLVDMFGKLNETTKTTSIAVLAIASGLGILLVVLGTLTTSFGALLPAMTAVGTFITGTLFTAIGSLILPLLAIGVAVISVVGAWDDMVIAAKIISNSIIGVFKKFVQIVLDFFGVDLAKAPGLFSKIFNQVISGSKTFVSSTISAMVNLPRLITNKVVGVAIDSLNFLLKGYNKIVKSLGFGNLSIGLADAFEPFKADYKLNWEEVKDITTKGVDRAIVEAKKIGGKLALVGSTIGNQFAENFSKGIGTIRSKISEGLSSLKGLLSGIFLKPQVPKDPQEGGGGGGALPEVTGGPPPESKTLWDEWADHVGSVLDTVKQASMDLYDSLSSGFSQAVGDMLTDGVSFAESMKSLFGDMVNSIISSLVKMAIQAVASSFIASAATNVQADTQIVAHAATAASGAASSQASIPFVGPILALVAAAAMFASVMAFRGKLKLATGGITQGPTNALIGEAGQEAVIPLDKLDSIIGERQQTITIMLDGRQIARSVIKNAPREIRLFTGVVM